MSEAQHARAEPRKRSARSIALIAIGGAGTLLCVAAMVGVWWLNWRLNHARQQLELAADEALELVGQKTIAARTVVGEANITANEMEQRLRTWNRENLTERASDRLELKPWLERVSQRVEQTQQVLEGTQEAVDAVERLLAIVGELGLPVSGEVLDTVSAQVVELRGEVDSIKTAVADLRAQLADDETVDQSRLLQAAQLFIRLLATFDRVDQRLSGLADRVLALQQQVAQVSNRTRWQLLLATMIVTLLLVWMAAGQVSLWQRGIGR